MYVDRLTVFPLDIWRRFPLFVSWRLIGWSKTVSTQIVTSSPKAAEVGSKKNTKYPFSELEPGQSFIVGMADLNLKSLRTRATQMSVNGKKFVVIVHDDLSPIIVEVARTA